MEMLKNKWLKIGLAAGMLFFLLYADLARASSFGEMLLADISAGALSFSIYVTQFIIGNIGGWLFSLAGALLEKSLWLNYGIGDSTFVEIGWRIFRDLANLAFVFVIIVIAFATILRWKEREMQSALARLIIVALLINFSLLFARIIIDVSHVLTSFFVGGFSQIGVKGVATEIANILKVEQLFLVKSEGEGQFADIKTFGPAMLSSITSIFFITIFTILGALTILAIAIMLFIRYVALGFLMVVMPAAWLLWILPATGQYYKMWWSNFLKYVIFAPTITLFLYLSVAATRAVTPALFAEEETRGIGVVLGAINIKNPVGLFSHMVLGLGLLIGSMMAAQRFGTYGSDIGMKGFGQLRKFGLARAKQVGRWAGVRALTAGAKPEEEKASYAQRLATGLAGIPGVRWLGGKLGGAAVAAKEAAEKRAKDIARLYKGEALKNLVRNRAFREGKGLIYSPERDAGIIGALGENPKELQELWEEADQKAEKKDFGLKNTLISMLKSAGKLGTAKEFLKVRPEMAEYVGEDAGKVASKLQIRDVVKDNAIQIATESLKNYKVTLNLDNTILGRIGSLGPDGKKEAVIESIKEVERNIALLSDKEKELLRKRKEFILLSPIWEDAEGLMPREWVTEKEKILKERSEKRGEAGRRRGGAPGGTPGEGEEKAPTTPTPGAPGTEGGPGAGV